MVSIIWLFFIVIGTLFFILTGNIEALNNEILQGGAGGIKLLTEMLPLLVLWTGIMQIAEDSHLLDVFAKIVRPVLSKLFPSLPKDHPALGYIASNIAANALGLGSAATPFGLKAMECLQKDNMAEYQNVLESYKKALTAKNVLERELNKSKGK